jgi:hypothetical protein
MSETARGKRWSLVVTAALAATGAMLVSTLGGFTDSGVAAGLAAPAPVTQPTITGTPQEGKVLTGRNGEWSGEPGDFNFFWTRCDKTGGSCADISGATAASYTLTSADVGNTVRFKVEASNADGSTFASSVPSAVVAAAAPPTPPAPPTGCPAGSGPVPAERVSAPARLVVDQMVSQPSVVSRGTDAIVLRFHVSNTCKQAVAGALVYATAVPFGQFAVPPEERTGADGWAEVRLHALDGFPVNANQQLIAMFVRARKPGGSLLSGISSRRLVSLPVRR